MENCVVVGRGLNYGNSYELALKLMETCYVVAERFSSADFFHGPLAIVERRFPVILFAPRGVTGKGNLDLLNRLKELHADCFSITNDDEIAAFKLAFIDDARGNRRISVADSVYHSGAAFRRVCWQKRKELTPTRRARFQKLREQSRLLGLINAKTRFCSISKQ